MKYAHDETAARKIARSHNARMSAGFGGNGKLVFDRHGNGGAWYSDTTYGFGDDAIIVRMRSDRMTYADSQAILDHAADDDSVDYSPEAVAALYERGSK